MGASRSGAKRLVLISEPLICKNLSANAIIYGTELVTKEFERIKARGWRRNFKGVSAWERLAAGGRRDVVAKLHRAKFEAYHMDHGGHP